MPLFRKKFKWRFDVLSFGSIVKPMYFVNLVQTGKFQLNPFYTGASQARKVKGSHGDTRIIFTRKLFLLRWIFVHLTSISGGPLFQNCHGAPDGSQISRKQKKCKGKLQWFFGRSLPQKLQNKLCNYVYAQRDNSKCTLFLIAGLASKNVFY